MQSKLKLNILLTLNRHEAGNNGPKKEIYSVGSKTVRFSSR